jgi:hypothetical protein
MSPRSDRLTRVARDRGKDLIAAGTDRMASTLRGRTKALAFAGTALAVAGVGSMTGAGVASAATTGHGAASHGAASHGGASHGAAATAGRASKNRTTKGQPTADAVMAASAVAALPSIAELTSVTHKFPVTPVLPHAQGTASGAPSQPKVVAWSQVQHAFSPGAPQHGQPAAAEQLTPTGTSGPQSWMPMSPAQTSNATAIVQQALNKKMGIRSAVVAVATAMQESQLLNLHYGDLDSLGLFQQRPSMGWGTAAQITTPSYAAGAFLAALQQYQTSDPAWASQPLWANAQAVQKSGFPLAYAKWESQAAGLVKKIATRLV